MDYRANGEASRIVGHNNILFVFISSGHVLCLQEYDSIPHYD